MVTINLRDYYSIYENDVFVEVPDDLAEQLRQWERDENAYQRKRRWHHATYSLDRDDGIEKRVLFVSDSPVEHYEKRLTHEQLHAALAALPEKQAERICAHYFLGQSKAEIARREGVGKASVGQSISRGLEKIAAIIKIIS